MNRRQRELQNLRDKANSMSGNLDPFDDDRFDRMFERNLNVVDKVTRHPFLFGTGIVLLNLAIFAAGVGIVAFFVWLLFF